MAARPRLALFDLGVADVLTLGNGVVGMLAIVTLTVETPYLAWTKGSGISDELLAAILIGVGAVLDGLDGVLAARLGASPMGADLDSLSDLITFVLAPAVMVLTAFQGVHPAAAIVVALTVLVFGMARLARFNASPEHEARDFTGLPSPVAAAGIVLLVLTHDVLRVPAGLVLALVALLAFAMVSTVPYPKARRRTRSLAAGLLVFSVGVVAALALRPDLAEPILVASLAATLVVVAFGPITWVRLRRRGRGAGLLEPPEQPGEADGPEARARPPEASVAGGGPASGGPRGPGSIRRGE